MDSSPRRRGGSFHVDSNDCSLSENVSSESIIKDQENKYDELEPNSESPHSSEESCGINGAIDC